MSASSKILNDFVNFINRELKIIFNIMIGILQINKFFYESSLPIIFFLGWAKSEFLFQFLGINFEKVLTFGFCQDVSDISALLEGNPMQQGEQLTWTSKILQELEKIIKLVTQNIFLEGSVNRGVRGEESRIYGRII